MIYAFTILIIIILFSMGYVLFQSNKLPESRPAKFINKYNDKVLLCLGDSITQGSASCSYILLLEKLLKDSKIAVVNAGINGDLAYKLNLRLEEAIKCNPEYITILIGTNDIITNSFEEIRKMALKGKKLKPDYVTTKEAFIEEVQAMISKLKNDTHAKIALISIPILGEEIDSPENGRIKLYNESLKALAMKEGIEYLDLFEMQIQLLKDNRSKPGIVVDKDIYNKLYIALFKRYFLKKSWDDISKDNRMQLTIEGMHMNSKSASMISKLIYSFIFTNEQKGEIYEK